MEAQAAPFPWVPVLSVVIPALLTAVGGAIAGGWAYMQKRAEVSTDAKKSEGDKENKATEIASAAMKDMYERNAVRIKDLETEIVAVRQHHDECRESTATLKVEVATLNGQYKRCEEEHAESRKRITALEDTVNQYVSSGCQPKKI